MTPETAIKKQIREYLAVHKWFAFPILQGMGAHKGIADIIAIKNGNVLFIEAKAPRGRQSDHQVEFEHNIINEGGHYLIARSYEDIRDYLIKHDL
jgi:Holliday junction resolvase